MRLERRQVAYNYDIRNRSIQYIIIHGTATPGATPEDEFTLHNRANRGASAEIFIDDNQAIEIMNSDKYNAWAIGVGNKGMGAVHDNSINIEMCIDYNGKITDKTFLNTVDITKQLMKKYNIPISRVLRHRDVCYKECPTQLINGSWVAWNRWEEFKDRLINNNESEEINMVVKDIPQNFKIGDARVNGKTCIVANDTWISLPDKIGYLLNNGEKVTMYSGTKLRMERISDFETDKVLINDPVHGWFRINRKDIAISEVYGDLPVKEVIKEVPVEKIVEKEVIKEVEVNKNATVVISGEKESVKKICELYKNSHSVHYYE